MSRRPRDSSDAKNQAAALGCRAHTGWAALVAIAGDAVRPWVVLRCRAELADPTGNIRRNVYQTARGLEPATAAGLVEAAERIASERAAVSIEQALRQADADGARVETCGVVVGMAPAGAGLESILRSHALAHAAEGRLYQGALLRGAASCGLKALPVPKRSIWTLGESALGITGSELRCVLDGLRGEVGPPWAEDQKLAALAAWVALAQSR